MAAPRPYPLDELLEVLGIAGEAKVEQARRLGVDPAMVHRWARTGLSEVLADRLACAAGVHPGVVWTAWWPD